MAESLKSVEMFLALRLNMEIFVNERIVAELNVEKWL
jgi:hypothetical protein